MLLFGVMGALTLRGLASGAGAAALSNPYRLIAERNAFGLRPVPPVTVQKAAPRLPNVILTGITTILKGKRALLKIEFPPTPPTPAKPRYCILAEGQREGPVEVLEINEHTSKVKVNNSGTVMTITFSKPRPAPPTSPTSHPRVYLRRFPVRGIGSR